MQHFLFRRFERENLSEINDNATSDKNNWKLNEFFCQMVIYVNHMVAKKCQLNSSWAQNAI